VSRRRWLVLGACVLAVPVIAVAGVELAWAWGVGQLTDAGVTIDSTQSGLTARALNGVAWGPVQVEQVFWDVRTPTVVIASGVRVQPELGSASEGDGQGDGVGVPAVPDWLVVELDDVDVFLDAETPIAQDMSGSWSVGLLELTGPDAHLVAPGDGVDLELTLSQRLDADVLRGLAQVQVTVLDGVAQIHVEGDDWMVRHARLSPRPLPLPRVVADLVVDEALQLSGPVQVGDARIELTGACTDDCRLTLELPDQDADAVLRVFEPIVPELKRATVSGTLGGTVQVGLFSKTVDLEPRIGELVVQGAVQNLGELRSGRFQHRALDAQGDVIVRTTGEGTRGWVPLRSISPFVPAAVIASEDSRFRAHAGYDPVSIAAAVQANRDADGWVRGGSTLTQQLAKNLYLEPDRTVERKLRELLLAVELDRALGKDRVMELYLNVVEFGPGIWGVGAATDRYFLKSPANLQPHEAAFMAALLPDPRTFYNTRYLRGRANQLRTDWILTNMADGGVLTAAEARRWANTPLVLIPPPR
jgi:hypothetical protein